MKTQFVALALLISCMVSACKPSNPSPYQRIWKASLVKENNLVVYSAGSVTNIYPGYSQFLLDLSSVNLARLTDYTGQTMTGKWVITADNAGSPLLRLTELLPEPALSGGTLDYTIRKEPGNEFILLNTKDNPKTGNTRNEYTLVPGP